jgi:UDP-glucose 4-epimerase
LVGASAKLKVEHRLPGGFMKSREFAIRLGQSLIMSKCNYKGVHKPKQRTFMILVTGGGGYIGSHICVELLNAGHEIVVFDNLANSKLEALRRVEKICGVPVNFRRGDLKDAAAVRKLFEDYPISSVIHLAGLKAVGESVREPLSYFANNVTGSLHLFSAMKQAGVKKLVFSSSATVYGEPQFLPLTEDHPLSVVNPYGRTKLMIEDILRDQFQASADWSIAVLRYFNPVGAHESGWIGEDPQGIPGNLVPFVARVAVGRENHVNVFGNDYPTADGTGVRDYVHVVDLAKGHLSALNQLSRPLFLVVNLGTGQGHSVLEVIEAFEQASGRKVPYVFKPRRTGDVATCYADVTKAEAVLCWKAERDLQTMCADHWRWQRDNPQGYNN